MGDKPLGADEDAKPPPYVVALYDYDPFHGDIQLDGEPHFAAPSVDSQLSYSRAERMAVLSKKLDWWIMCRSLDSGKSGYVSTTQLAPVCAVIEPDECDTEVIANGTRSSSGFHPSLDYQSVNLKYFPHSPDAVQRQMSQKACPESEANFLSRLTFWWINSLVVTGWKRPLLESDLWQLDPKRTASVLLPSFQKVWDVEMEKMRSSPVIEKLVKVKSKKHSKKHNVAVESEGLITDTPDSEPKFIKRHKYKPSLTKTIFKCFWSTFLITALLKLIFDVLQFLNPWLLGKLITFVSSKGAEETWRGYFYAAILFGVVTLQSLFLHQYFHRAFIVGMDARSSILAMIYRKMLRLNSVGRHEFTVGEMVNLMSVDAQKCNDIMIYLHILWSGPFQIVVGLALLYDTMGWSVFPGLLVMVFMMPINIFVTQRTKTLQSKQMKHKDLRSKLMNEILAGIRVLKLYAWEEAFINRIMGYRKDELTQLKAAMRLSANFSFTITCAPFLVSLVTFAAYVLSGNELTAKQAFVSIALFNIIRFPMSILPMVINNVVQYHVAVKRLSRFLKAEELDPNDIEWLQDNRSSPVAISVENGTFTWGDREAPVLSNVNMTVYRKSLVAVVGQVGTGKSTLLSAILGEPKKVSGSIKLNGSVAYVPQQAWIQNETVQENVLFGKQYQSKKYSRVVDACALRQDFSILPGGDLTEIGEKGINLSGGQKQRVSLARAVYDDADIYLFDDPLSAVDAHVGKHIFDNIIGPEGLLKNKVRVLVTNNLSVLPHTDHIFVLKDGNISESGTYHELVKSEGDFAEFLATYLTEGTPKEEKATDEQEQSNINHGELIEKLQRTISKISQEASEIVSMGEIGNLGAHFSSTISLYTPYKSDPSNPEHVIGEMLERHEVYAKREAKKQLINQETSETGRVRYSVFVTYAKCIGYVISFVVVFLAFVSEAVLIGSRIWLADWSSRVNITNEKRDVFLGVYGALGFGQGLCVLIEAYILAVGSYVASKQLHNDLLRNVLRCPMSFFETTPMGRIVNRFSKDINTIDEAIPRSLRSFLGTFTACLGTVFVISYSTPIFLSVLFPLIALYVLTQRFYVASSRQLMRIEAVRRSPIYNHFFESINGASTIRAYHQNERFIQQNEIKVDNNQAAYFPSVVTNRWLAMRLEFVGNAITFFAALFAIVQRDDLTAGLAGLSISYALQVTQTLNWMVRMTSELETNIIAVERVKEYIEAPTEAAWINEDNRPDPSWPSKGVVEIADYSVRYRDGLDLVLRNISCSVSSAQKIGIVGRTGAGKSSFALSLFRIIEAATGKIVIDGIDIARIGLRDLRSKLTIIPQDPVLFSGTIRFNLDPFDAYDDSELWKALEVARLKELVSNLPNKLNYEVAESGENLSVGQRQLVCLGRALLRKTKVLILDEATAAVDMETDDFIQQTIRSEFKDCTVLTIAHRLNTIIDYDRLLVLDNGRIVEFGTPAELLAKKDGLFYGMARDAGLAS